MVWRRVRDSNPRFLLREHIISSDAPSTSRTTLRAIFQPNFSNLNLGKWREKLERKLFNLFNCTAKTPINQGFSRRGFQSDHWFSSAPRYDHFDTSPYMVTPESREVTRLFGVQTPIARLLYRKDAVLSIGFSKLLLKFYISKILCNYSVPHLQAKHFGQFYMALNNYKLRY